MVPTSSSLSNQSINLTITRVNNNNLIVEQHANTTNSLTSQLQNSHSSSDLPQTFTTIASVNRANDNQILSTQSSTIATNSYSPTSSSTDSNNNIHDVAPNKDETNTSASNITINHADKRSDCDENQVTLLSVNFQNEIAMKEEKARTENGKTVTDTDNEGNYSGKFLTFTELSNCKSNETIATNSTAQTTAFNRHTSSNYNDHENSINISSNTDHKTELCKNVNNKDSKRTIVLDSHLRVLYEFSKLSRTHDAIFAGQKKINSARFGKKCESGISLKR